MIKQIDISEIPGGQYTGYLWYSDVQQAIVYQNTEIASLPKQPCNPFIIEGHLASEDGRFSYSIRMVDGQYLVFQYDLKALDNLEKSSEDSIFMAHRLEGQRKLVFRQYWHEHSDDSTEGMPVLKPYAHVFIKFN